MGLAARSKDARFSLPATQGHSASLCHQVLCTLSSGPHLSSFDDPPAGWNPSLVSHTLGALLDHAGPNVLPSHGFLRPVTPSIPPCSGPEMQ